VNGILCIDKPCGPSSMAAVAQVKRALGVSRVGHSGTLDPKASGLLVTALGHATRLLPYLPLEPKAYLFTIVFGTATDTLDSDGAVVAEGGAIPGEEQIRAVLGSLVGEIEQTPPRYSAVKVRGVRAYRLARNSRLFSLSPRKVRIRSLTLNGWDAVRGEAAVLVECSAGTYVRSLARDMAEKLGTVGYASSIRRSAMGMFSVEGALAPDAAAHELAAHVVPLDRVLAEQPGHIASARQIRALSHGQDIRIETFPAGHHHIFVFDDQKKLLAVARRVDHDTYHPVRVFGES